MDSTAWQILIILVLTLFNGFFSCSEIALISIRKTRVNELVKQGNRRAKIIKDLHLYPESLFATIQIGISIITILASALAGSKLAIKLAEYLSQKNIPFVSGHTYSISFIIIVLLLSYINLVIGELVPKSLGLRYSERFALLAAYPIWWLAKISHPLVKLLSFSSNILLKPFQKSASFVRQAQLSEEEIRSVIAEGQKAGTIDAHEHSIIENIFEFSDLTVGRIMVPRTQIVAFDIDAPVKETIQQAIASGYSRLPIYQGNLNNIVGILYTKKLLKNFGDDVTNLKLEEFLLPPYFVPGSMEISEVLQRLQRKKLHMALISDEHGEIEGLVTMEDVMEEIVGDIADETDETNKTILKQEDGTFLVEGEVSIVDFNKNLQTHLPEDEDYTTVSGFIINRLGRFPKDGDTILHDNLEFTVKEKTFRTVKTAIVKKK